MGPAGEGTHDRRTDRGEHAGAPPPRVRAGRSDARMERRRCRGADRPRDHDDVGRDHRVRHRQPDRDRREHGRALGAGRTGRRTAAHRPPTDRVRVRRARGVPRGAVGRRPRARPPSGRRPRRDRLDSGHRSGDVRARGREAAHRPGPAEPRPAHGGAGDGRGRTPRGRGADRGLRGRPARLVVGGSLAALVIAVYAGREAVRVLRG